MWRPIESLPRDGRRFLYAQKNDDGWLVAVGYLSDEGGDGPAEWRAARITHWQPLPNPPETP